jgi:hypothetical protein
MKKIFTLMNIGIGLAVLLVLSQFIRIDYTNPSFEAKDDFLRINKTSPEISNLMRVACYDCHSNETTYPWYSGIAPFSWWVKDHVNDGRRHLNFSIWGTYKTRRQDKKLMESAEEIEDGEMPMDSYTWMHDNAQLNDYQKKLLIGYFNSLRTHEADKEEEK